MDKEWDRDEDVQGLHILSDFLTTEDQDRESEDDYFKKKIVGRPRTRTSAFYGGLGDILKACYVIRCNK